MKHNLLCEKISIIIALPLVKQVGKRTRMMKVVKKYGIKNHVTEPSRHNQNRAEGVIRKVEKKWFCTMDREGAQKALRL